MSLGLPELIVIGVLVALFFGPGRLPEVLGSLGKSARAWKDALEENAHEPRSNHEDDDD